MFIIIVNYGIIYSLLDNKVNQKLHDDQRYCDDNDDDDVVFFCLQKNFHIHSNELN